MINKDVTNNEFWELSASKQDWLVEHWINYDHEDQQELNVQ